MKLSAHKAWWIAAVLLGMAGIMTRLGDPAHGAQQSMSLPTLGLEVGESTCSAIDAQQASYHDPNVDVAGWWMCRGKAGLAMEIYLGYLANSSGGKRILSPLTNYPSGDAQQRWNHRSKDKVEIPLARLRPPTLPATTLLLKHASGRQAAVLYWYHLDGSSLADEFHYRLALMLRKLARQSSASAIVRIASWVQEHEVDAALASQQEFAASLYPSIKSALP
jgi:EpsI family protein